MFYHEESGTYIQHGQPLTLTRLVSVNVPAVIEPTEDGDDVIVVSPAHTEQQLRDVQYPANWLTLSSPEDRAELGIEEVRTEGTRGDDRYFWVSETLVGAVRTIVNTPKDAEMVAAMYAAEVDIKKVAIRRYREDVINRLNGVADRLARKGNTTVRAAADDAVEALLDITKDLPVNPAEVDNVVTQRYKQIAATLPVELLAAFDRLN